ncbi:MAG: hypothetical protein U5L01_05455 [Rheinheimera sp.]|nr:hypothetical protein [Rheinheimera sp.]
MNAASYPRRYGAEFSAEWHQTEFWQHRLSATTIDARFQTPDQALINGRQLLPDSRETSIFRVCRSNWYHTAKPAVGSCRIVLLTSKIKWRADDRNQRFAPAAALYGASKAAGRASFLQDNGKHGSLARTLAKSSMLAQWS